ncbi:glycosyltransferase [Ectothiorhodospira haloalkaliphila]|nr:glycosyltransferase [Ectothiorhodospira haloalkaliphila]MCG5523517.1 glycosyltransferase [Ectothiorhodospira haloalkaliphila]
MANEPSVDQIPPVALLFATSGHSGVDRVVQNLLPELGRLEGQRFDLLTIGGHGPHVERLPPNVRRISLPVGHKNWVLPSLCLYLYRHRPRALLSANHPLNRAALLARRITGVKTHVVIRMGMALAAQGTAGPGKPRRVIRSMARWYPDADVVVTPSQGVAKDLAHLAKVPADRLHVIPNPIVNGGMMQLSKQSVEHPWFADKDQPVILGVGELSERKDFPTLLNAFALVRQQRKVRLVILGEGRCRANLEQLADELGIRDDLWLPGFEANPYRFMHRADLFVSASRREGSSAVIVEALAHGLPVVSTDCPSGPAETLAGGRYGHLVPIGDVQTMARAMVKLLDSPPDAAHQQEGAVPFSAAASAAAYVQALGLRQP